MDGILEEQKNQLDVHDVNHLTGIEIKKKKCAKCLGEKSIDDFAFSNKKQSKRQSWCKICCYEYFKHRIVTNTEYYLRFKAAQRDRCLSRHKFIFEYLKSHPCVDCGETNPLILEFDHEEDKIKQRCVTGLSGCSEEKILEEIDKCNVRCSNCHTKQSLKRSNSIRYQFCVAEGYV